MKGLERKCFVASAFTHGLLVVLLFVGSAFVSKKPQIEAPAFELFTIPEKLIDEPNIVSGGNPNVTAPPQIAPQQPAPIQQQSPAPTPQQETLPEPKPPEPVKQPAPKAAPQEQVPEPIKPVESKPELKSKEPDPNAFDLKKAVQKTAQPKPPKPATNFDFGKAEKKTIKPSTDAKSSADAESESRAQRDKQMAQARAGALSDTLKRMQGGLSSVGGSYDIPGPGGAAYASYGLALQKFYENAWIPPNAGRPDEPIVQVEVVIAKDGTILSQTIVKKSGRRELDISVQNTLNRVFKAKAPPFPSGSTDQKRTFRINFNLTEKLNLG